MRQHGDLRIGEYLDYADKSIASLKLPGAARFVTVYVAPHAERVSVFQDFNWCIQRIGHVSLYTGDTVEPRACAHTAGSRLIVCELLACARVYTTNSEVAHCASAGRRYALRNRFCERAEQHVHDPLGRFHVASGNGSRRQGIDNASRRSLQLEWSQDSSRCWCIVSHQAAQHIETCRESDGADRVDTARNLS